MFRRFPANDRRDEDISPAEMAPLSDEDKRTLLHIARQTLETFLTQGKRPEIYADSPALRQVRAAFVTLWRRDTGELRGCRGECIPRRPLTEAVVRMTIASALDDPRFQPVTAQEVPLLRIDINALTPLRPIHPDEVEVGRHGLMIVRAPYAGLLLPDVPARLGWDRIQFLAAVCEKAGLPQSAWRDAQTDLYGFESEEWGEEE